MPTNSTNPSWIEPPPPRPKGMGCVGKGCLSLVVILVLGFLVLVGGGYFFVSHVVISSKPMTLPAEELPEQTLTDVQQRVDQFKATASPRTSAPVEPVAPNEPTPAPAATPGRELILSAGEINGLISANAKSRGRAHVNIQGNTATVQMSVPSDKVPGFSEGYLNGTFAITTDGPTPLSAIRVSKIRANGYPVPSAILTMSYRGHSILGYALDAVAPYDVKTAEIRDGSVVLH